MRARVKPKELVRGAFLCQKSVKMTRALYLLLLLQQSVSFSLLQRTSSVNTVLRASDDAIDASSPDAFLAGLMNRVDELKARQLELPIVVLDATLPNQRLAISTSDQAFREMVEFCGVKAVVHFTKPRTWELPDVYHQSSSCIYFTGTRSASSAAFAAKIFSLVQQVRL